MSEYVTAKGKLTFKDTSSFDQALALLQEGRWMDGNGILLNEIGEPLARGGRADRKTLSINFPCNELYRNVSEVFAEVAKLAASGEIKAASTDGCFWFCRMPAGGELEDLDQKATVKSLVDSGLVKPFSKDDPYCTADLAPGSSEDEEIEFVTKTCHWQRKLLKAFVKN